MMTSEKKIGRPTCMPRRDDRSLARRRLRAIASGRQVPVRVLHHHDRRIDEHTDRQRQIRRAT